MRPIDPAALAARLEALGRLIETARAIAPYRCELEDPAEREQAGRIHEMLLQAERETARMRLDLLERTAARAMR